VGFILKKTPLWLMDSFSKKYSPSNENKD